MCGVGGKRDGGRVRGSEERSERMCKYVLLPLTSYWCRKGLVVKEGFLVRLTPFFLE